MGMVVFSGHGGFDTSTNPPWVQVPEGTTLYFYSDNLKALLDSNGQVVETLSSVLQGASPSQVVYGGQSCPNYTLYPPDGLDIQDSPDGVEQIIVNGATLLSEMLTWGNVAGNECYWAACRVVDLQDAGGSFLGVNEGQNELGGTDVTTDGDAEWAQQFSAWFQTASEQDRLDFYQNQMTDRQVQGMRLVDESFRQWEAQLAYGDLNDSEMANYIEWFRNASPEEQDQSWNDLTPEQQDQVREYHHANRGG